MKKTTETRWTKMVSVRMDKKVYEDMMSELELQRNISSGRGSHLTLSALINQMISEQLDIREEIRMHA